MNDLAEFIVNCPCRFFAVEGIRQRLEKAGYVRLTEGRRWALRAGGKYYVIRGGAAIAAFRIPDPDFDGFMVSASHSDAPTFHIKENAELVDPATGYVRINAERYGGLINACWLDRPLSVAGRVLVKTGDKIESRLAYIDRDLLLIPNLAIHLNREANNGYKYDPKCDLVPLMGIGEGPGELKRLVAEAVGCRPEDILGSDLYLCSRQKPVIWGAHSEFISSPRLDDLQCAFGCFMGFMGARDAGSVPIYALLDGEEIGNQSKQSADSTFLSDVVESICAGFGKDRATMLSNTFMVSADNAHAVHPNHPELSDPSHRVLLNGGVVIKHGPRYATDGASQAVFTEVCRRAGVPVQHFANRSDLAGGGTLGLASDSHLSVATVDIGLAQLAMHSVFETGGVEDTDHLIRAMTEFYSCVYREEDGVYSIG